MNVFPSQNFVNIISPTTTTSTGTTAPSPYLYSLPSIDPNAFAADFNQLYSSTPFTPSGTLPLPSSQSLVAIVNPSNISVNTIPASGLQTGTTQAVNLSTLTTTGYPPTAQFQAIFGLPGQGVPGLTSVPANTIALFNASDLGNILAQQNGVQGALAGAPFYSSTSTFASGVTTGTQALDAILRQIAIGDFSSSSTTSSSLVSTDPKESIVGFLNTLATTASVIPVTNNQVKIQTNSMPGQPAQPIRTYDVSLFNFSNLSGSSNNSITTVAQAVNSSLGQLLYQEFLKSQGVNFTVNSSGLAVVDPPLTDSITGDWSAFNSLISSTNQPPFDNVDNFMQNAFVTTINHFLSSFNWNILLNSSGNLPGGSNALTPTGNELNTFLNGYSTFLAGISSIQTPNFPVGSNLPSEPTLSSTLTPVSELNYYQIYQSFVPGATGNPATDKQFQSMLLSFYNQTVKANGFFVPSQNLGAWFQAVLSAGRIAKGTSFTSDINNGAKLIVIGQIIALLISMINTIQNVSLSQAARLQYLSNYQTAYLNLIQKIPTITSGQLSKIPTTGDTGNQQLNTQQQIQAVNSNYTSLLQAYQGQVGDWAKAMQSTVDNTNQNQSQAASLIQSLLQMLATMLQAIFTK